MRKAVAKVSQWQWLASGSTDRSLERALARAHVVERGPGCIGGDQARARSRDDHPVA